MRDASIAAGFASLEPLLQVEMAARSIAEAAAEPNVPVSRGRNAREPIGAASR